MGFKTSDSIDETADVRDTALGAFLGRRREDARHWAAPKVEAARAWGEYGLADSTYRAQIAGKEGRRLAEDAKDQLGPQLAAGAERANTAVHEGYARLAPAVSDQYKKYAPQVAAGLAAVSPALAGGLNAVQGFLADVQGQAESAGKDVKKTAEKKGKTLKKQTAKNRKAVAKQAAGLKKDLAKQGKAAAKATKKGAAQGGQDVQAALLAGLAALQAGQQKLSPEVQRRVADATKFAQDRRDQYVPVAAARLADASGKARKSVHDYKVPASVEDTLVRVTGDKKIVKKLRKAAEGYAATAEKGMKKQARQAKRQSRSGKGWIVSGMAVAAAGAAYAIWKLTKPVEDPWKAPAPGPVTANIPVVDAHGSTDPYAKQRAAIAEAQAARDGVVQAGGDVQVDTVDTGGPTSANPGITR
jgi:hypothetical protein